MSKYQLKEGVVLTPFGPGSSITNENLTNSIAEFLIESGRASKDDFESVDGGDEVKGEVDQVVELTKLEIVEKLKSLGVDFDPKSKKDELLTLLNDHIKSQSVDGGDEVK